MKFLGRQVRRLQKALKSLKMIGDFRNFRKILRTPKPRRLFINFSKKFWKSPTFFEILGKLHFPLPGTHQTCFQSTTQKKEMGKCSIFLVRLTFLNLSTVPTGAVYPRTRQF